MFNTPLLYDIIYFGGRVKAFAILFVVFSCASTFALDVTITLDFETENRFEESGNGQFVSLSSVERGMIIREISHAGESVIQPVPLPPNVSDHSLIRMKVIDDKHIAYADDEFGIEKRVGATIERQQGAITKIVISKDAFSELYGDVLKELTDSVYLGISGSASENEHIREPEVVFSEVTCTTSDFYSLVCRQSSSFKFSANIDVELPEDGLEPASDNTQVKSIFY